MKFNKNNNVNTQNGNNVWSIEFATEVINSYAKEMDEDIMPIVNESRKVSAEKVEIKKEQMIKEFGNVKAEILEANFHYFFAGAYASGVMISMGKSDFYRKLVFNILEETYFRNLVKKYGEAKVNEITAEFRSEMRDNIMSNYFM